MITLTETQAAPLAHLLHQIRPDWPVKSILTILWQNRDVPSLAAVTIAAASKAADPTCKTPAPIFTRGSHWPQEVRHQIAGGPRCEDHPEEDATTCRCCHADVKTGDRPTSHIGKHWASQ